jgi:hypothetical protein
LFCGLLREGIRRIAFTWKRILLTPKAFVKVRL